MSGEEFRPVPGFPGYEISRRGRVRTVTGYALTASPTGLVQLRSCGRICRRPAAELAAAAFPPEPAAPESPPESHKNGAAQLVCPICGKRFAKRHGTQRYCGPLCAREAIRRQHAEDQRGRRNALRAQEKAADVAAPGGKRRCHDCGRPTFNYRCEKCWAKLRGRTDVEEDAYVCAL